MVYSYDNSWNAYRLLFGNSFAGGERETALLSIGSRRDFGPHLRRKSRMFVVFFSDAMSKCLRMALLEDTLIHVCTCMCIFTLNLVTDMNTYCFWGTWTAACSA